MPTFGEELKRERELRKIPLREISEATKINIRYLESIEKNDFEHLPGGVFARGFVRAYAQYIGIDPEVMVNAYLLELKAQKGETPVDGGLLRRGAWPEDVADEPRRARRRIGVIVLGVTLIVLILAGAAVAWWFLRPEAPS
jgi:cytoskeletal protein RodZ